MSAQEKWMEFAPTSPQRRNSFVSEPGAVAGNPFEIYRAPDHNNDRLMPNSFYEAGAPYAVSDRSTDPFAAPDPFAPPTGETLTAP
jgi:hypothetical protein